MPGRPFLRAFKAKLKEHGGWSVILERRANGETMQRIAQDYGCSRSWLSHQLNDDPKLRELHTAAKIEAASALAEQATELVDAAPVDRDALTKAKLQAEQRRWLASVYDREQFGEVQQAGVTINIDTVYLDALKRVNREARLTANMLLTDEQTEAGRRDGATAAVLGKPADSGQHTAS